MADERIGDDVFAEFHSFGLAARFRFHVRAQDFAFALNAWQVWPSAGVRLKVSVKLASRSAAVSVCGPAAAASPRSRR